jgi:tetratricopeptide (TPR) repeat protein
MKQLAPLFFLFFTGICAFGQLTGVNLISRADSLKLLLNNKIQTREKSRLYLLLARELENTDPAQSLAYSENAWRLAKELKNDSLLIRSLISMGKNHLTLNNFNKAIELSGEAMHMAEQAGNLREAAYAGSLIAIVYAELGDFDKSSGYYFKNLTYFEKLNDKNELSVTYGNIGADFLSQKNYSKAIEYINKSLTLAKQTNDRIGIIQQLNNLGGVYYEGLSDNTKGLQYFREANKYARLDNDILHIGITSLNIGLVMSGAEMFDSAFFYYNIALDCFGSTNNRHRLADCLIQEGNARIKTGEIIRARVNGIRALEIGKEINSQKVVMDAAKLMHSLSMLSKDTSQAYNYYMMISNSKDSLVFKQSQKELYKAELQYNQEKIRKEAYYKQVRTYLTLGLVIMGLVISLLIILLVLSKQKLKTRDAMLQIEKTESELKLKNSELTLNMLALIKKHELLSGISDKLIDLEKNVKSDEAKQIVLEISKDLRQNTDDKMFAEFSARFQEVHAGFYEKLLSIHPNLTRNELKICAFLRLNMTTKDISELSGQSLTTIDQARFRLRKKLGIVNSEVNLVSYLTQIQ